MKQIKYYKILNLYGYSCYYDSHVVWFLPTLNKDGTWTPGEWMPEVEGELGPENGYHIVALEQLSRWLGERIFEVEVGDEVLPTSENSFVARRCRLIQECIGWDKTTKNMWIPPWSNEWVDEKNTSVVKVTWD